MLSLRLIRWHNISEGLGWGPTRKLTVTVTCQLKHKCSSNGQRSLSITPQQQTVVKMKPESGGVTKFKLATCSRCRTLYMCSDGFFYSPFPARILPCLQTQPGLHPLGTNQDWETPASVHAICGGTAGRPYHSCEAFGSVCKCVPVPCRSRIPEPSLCGTRLALL